MFAQSLGPEEIRDLVVESLNARDPELLAGAELGDSPVVETLRFAEERFPRMMLTRGDFHGEPVAAIWMPDANDTYIQSGHLEFVIIDESTVEMEIYDEVDPEVVAEAPAGFGVNEWETDGAIEQS